MNLDHLILSFKENFSTSAKCKNRVICTDKISKRCIVRYQFKNFEKHKATFHLKTGCQNGVRKGKQRINWSGFANFYLRKLAFSTKNYLVVTSRVCLALW